MGIVEHLKKVNQEQLKFRNETVGHLKHYDCPICLNRGYIWYLENDVLKSKDCECMPKRKINQTLALSGLAEDFKRYKLDNFKTDLAHHKNMYDKAMNFLDNPKCIYFGGQSGSGKSHLSTALVKILVERGYTDFEYLKFAEDFPMIQYSLRNFDDEISKPARDKLNRFGTCKLLYIDDFLKVGNLDNVFEMIDSRYKRNLITIISSETYLESIKDEAIYGRIYEMCQGNVVTIEKHENKNYRLKG